MIAALLLKYGIPAWLAKVAAIGLAAGLLIGAAAGYRSHLINSGIAIEAAHRDAIVAESDRRAHAQLEQANARTAAAQARLDAATARINEQGKEIEDGKAKSAVLQSDLVAGRRRLSVAIAGARQAPAAQQGEGAAAAGVDPGGADRADLDGRAAGDLEWLRQTRNDAIAGLRACIADYDAVKTAADAQ